MPLLAHRTEVDGRPAAYVCRGMVCERPVTDTEKVTRLLAEDVARLRRDAASYTPGDHEV